MKRFFLIVFGWMIGMSVQVSGHAGLIWRTPSTDSSASMPCGGGDIGMNVWVEEGDVLFYISRSGTFDEHNCLLNPRAYPPLLITQSFLKRRKFPARAQTGRRLCRDRRRQDCDTTLGRCISSGNSSGNK